MSTRRQEQHEEWLRHREAQRRARQQARAFAQQHRPQPSALKVWLTLGFLVLALVLAFLMSSAANGPAHQNPVRQDCATAWENSADRTAGVSQEDYMKTCESETDSLVTNLGGH